MRLYDFMKEKEILKYKNLTKKLSGLLTQRVM